MQKIQLLFENSPWLIIPSLLVGAIYALLLYLKGRKLGSVSWGQNINYALAGLRFFLVSLLCLLIVGPFIKQIRNTIEEPIVVFAVDNSASVAAIDDSSQWLSEIKNLQNEIQQQDYQVEVRSISNTNTLEGIEFSEQRSDLEGLLSAVETEYEGRNLSSVILVSDGIYNEGISPAYTSYPFTIHALGVGDTVPKQDLAISNLYFNKVAYQGNKFPLVAEVSNTGFAGESVTVSVNLRGKTLENQQITFEQNRGITSVEFLLDAEEEGMSHYVVAVESREEEFTDENNISHAYIEIIEGKESILLVAQSPHPDIKALKLAIEQNKNYEVKTAILGMSPWNPAIVANDKFDLVILHQIPGSGLNDAQLNQLVQDANAIWYIVGSQTNISMFNQSNRLIEIIRQGNETDEVSPLYNKSFTGFQLENDNQTVVNDYIPLKVPFGRINFKGEATPLLYQQIGNVETSQPMLVVGEVDDKKQAVSLADGFWRWRLQEYATQESTQAFDALLTKLVQYLSAKEDKRRFKVYPTKNEFEDTEAVVFKTEIYNDIYEEVYSQSVNLSLTTEDGEQRNYSYATNENNTQYRIGNLPEGVYRYQASVELDNEQLTSSGEFSVRRLEMETLTLTANHTLLKELASTSGGRFATIEAISSIEAAFQDQKSQSKIYTSEAFLPIINVKWLFFLLLALVSTEWGIRKYMGSY